jgi:hypothetical protein
MSEKKNDDLVELFVETEINEDTLNYICEYKLQASLNEDSYLRFTEMSVFDACEFAVRKRIPQTPIKFTLDDIVAYKCGCGEIINPIDYFCPFCGQALDWEDME